MCTRLLMLAIFSHAQVLIKMCLLEILRILRVRVSLADSFFLLWFIHNVAFESFSVRTEAHVKLRDVTWH